MNLELKVTNIETAKSKGPKVICSVHRMKMQLLLHLLAAAVLLLFAISHFAFLRMSDPSLSEINTVFPFFETRSVHLIAAFVELSVGLICVAYPGRPAASISILIFVGTVGWYHWSFYFTGGRQCGCLGLLGKLLHISKTAETIIPIGALFFLAGTTTPLLLAILRDLFKSRTLTLLLCIAGILSVPTTTQSQVVRITGWVDSADYNPFTSATFTNTVVHANFVVVLATNSWSLSLTNDNDSTWWAEILWDGTNTYTFGLDGGTFYSRTPPKSSSVFTTISPGSFYYSVDGDYLGLTSLWLTYGFAPNAVHTNKVGIVDMPANWGTSRGSPLNYGLKWLLGDWMESRFIEEFEVVQDHALDLDAKHEMLRWEEDPPETLNEYNDFRLAVNAHRLELHNGYVRARYQCTGWFQTNGISIPLQSKFETFLTFVPLPHNRKESPVHQAKVQVASVELEQTLTKPLEPDNTNDRKVHDYRYKQIANQRIFKYAQYQLKPGEDWKSYNDPKLLAEADDWLKHGRKFDDFGLIFGIPERTLLSWSVLVVAALMPALVVIWKKTKNKNK